MSNLTLSLYLLLLIGLSSCEDCSDCDLAVTNPAVQIKLNDDSEIHRLEQQVGVEEGKLEDLEHLETTLSEQISGLETARQQLLDSPTANPEDLNALQEEIDSKTVTLQAHRLAIDSLKSDLDSLSEELEEARDGEVIIHLLENLETSKSVESDQVHSIHSLPLNIDRESTSLRLWFADHNFEIRLRHTNTTRINENREFVVGISGIEISSHDFIRVEGECPEPCNSDENIFVLFY